VCDDGEVLLLTCVAHNFNVAEFAAAAAVPGCGGGGGGGGGCDQLGDDELELGDSLKIIISIVLN
jgi:hypothetical protein